MEFHDYGTIFDNTRRCGIISGVAGKPNASRDEWYEAALADAIDDVREGVSVTGRGTASEKMRWSQLHAERAWLRERRPYYSVFPLVAESLLRLPLDLDSGLIRMPLPQLLVRLPKGHELDVLDDGTHRLRSCFATETSTDRGPGIMLWADFGETVSHAELLSPNPIYSFRCFYLRAGESLEKVLSAIDYTDADGAEEEAALRQCVRLVCTLCLLGNDPEMVTPDVLTDDRRKYEETGDQRYIDKAIKRGKRGWLIGAKVEIDPHYRRPHFALRWTGKGRAIPRICPIKGSVVHRHKLSEIPTGFLDDEGSAPSKLAREAAQIESQLNERLDNG